MKYAICFIGGSDMIIDQEARDFVWKHWQAGTKVIELGPDIILCSSISRIVSAETYLVVENRTLAKRNKFMCAAGEIHDRDEKCGCPPSDSLFVDASSVLEAPKQETFAIRSSPVA